ncbi:hypothetical protein [Candidatus Villigracilis affinis]|uniref:hypothetical protein n=1 Tax=Candidatus Villigracilis affinis TaxID=3140682 RepID=UPI001D771E49|nr:hypothetical protein [Anaerolineales bacterium]
MPKVPEQVVADEFNCLSIYSDAQPDQCSELNFLVIDAHQQERQFKPPSLRNVSARGPFMHAVNSPHSRKWLTITTLRLKHLPVTANWNL